MPYEFVAKKGLIAQGNSQVSGTLKVTNGVIADLTGTASWARQAVTASYAYTSSYELELEISSTWASSSISSSHALYADYAASASIADQAISAYSADSASNATTADNATNASTADNATNAVNAQTASLSQFAYLAESASYASASKTATTASYVSPGAMLWVVSGSNGVAPACLAPYDYSADNVYRPFPRQEGYTHWDHKWVNWAVYDDVGARTHLGREICIAVHNPTATAIPRLAAVYISGSSPSLNPTWSTTYKPDVYVALADGTGTKSDVAGIVRQAIPSGSDGYILIVGSMHNSDVSSYGPVGTRLWLSPTIDGGGLNVTTTKPGQPYEAVSLGYIIETGTQGSILAQIEMEPLPSSAYAGITIAPIITNPENGTIGIGTGSVNLFDDATGEGAVNNYGLPETTMSLVTGSTNYIVAERTGSVSAKYTLTTDQYYANGINIVRVATLDIYQQNTSSWDVHTFEIGVVGLALANKLNNKDIRLYGYQRESGLTLYTTGSVGDFGISDGIIWYGPNPTTVPPYDTTLAGYYTYYFHTTGSGWAQTSGSKYLCGVYDGTTSSEGFETCAPLSWSVNFVYRLIGTSDEAAIVMSNAQYATELEASNNAQTPPNLPSTIRDIGLLVGRIIVQSGSYGTAIVESAYSNTFVPAVVTNHESLLGLQGSTIGGGGGHYHMTAEDYVGSGTGMMMRQNSPTASNIMHTPATPYHVPYWSINKTLTYTGSMQVYLGQYVLINSASVTVGAEEALLVKQVNTASVSTVGAYSEVNNFSQIYNQNFSSGAFASTDICATADIGNQDANFIDMGIASSQYSHPSWPFEKPLDGYLYIHGGDLWLGTLTDNKILFVFNNTASTNYADKTGFYLSGSLFGTSSWAESASFAVTASAATSVTFVPTTAVSCSWISESILVEAANTASVAHMAYAINFVPLTATSASWVSASAKITTADTASYVAVANIDGTPLSSTSASFASASALAYSINFVPNTALTSTQSLYAKSASWVSASVRITTSDTASYVSVNNIDGTPLSATSASYASASGMADSISFVPQTSVSASWASQSLSSSHALTADSADAITFVPRTALSASWVSASVKITTADTASYVLVASIDGTVLSATSASWASASAVAYSINFKPQNVVSASYASQSLSSSYAANVPETASYALAALSASHALSADSADAITFVPHTAHFATQSLNATQSISASYAFSASYAPSAPSISSSYADSALTASHAIESELAYSINFVPLTATSASWVSASVKITTADTASYVSAATIGTPTSAVSASWASSSLNAISASVANTASYAFGIPTIKSGIVAGGSFAGAPRTATVTFTKPFPNNNYSVVVTGESSRTYTIQSKVSGSFVINANNNTAFTNNVFWQAISTGEYYS